MYTSYQPTVKFNQLVLYTVQCTLVINLQYNSTIKYCTVYTGNHPRVQFKQISTVQCTVINLQYNFTSYYYTVYTGNQPTLQFNQLVLSTGYQPTVQFNQLVLYTVQCTLVINLQYNSTN